MVNEEVGEGDVINGCRYQSIRKYIHGIAVGWPVSNKVSVETYTFQFMLQNKNVIMKPKLYT